MAVLTIVKTDSPDPAVVGLPLTYTLSVTNLGPDPALNVILTDLLPAGATFNSASFPCTPAGNVITCNLGTIAVGATSSVTINVTPTTPGQITNGASAAGANTNVAQATATTTVLTQTTLTLTKVDTPDPAFVGGTLTYTLTITNTGPAPAVDVRLTDLFPDSFVLLSVSAPCTLQPKNVLTCNLGTIPAGGTATVTLTVRPTLPGTFGNAASVTAATVPVTVVAVVTTQVILAADVAVTKTASAFPVVNQGLIYTVTVTNFGPSPATDVVLVDILPAGVRFVSATPSQGTCDVAGFRITCLIGTLAPGETETVTILVVPTQLGVFTNTATVTANEFDPNPANNTASLTVVVTQCSTGPQIC